MAGGSRRRGGDCGGEKHRHRLCLRDSSRWTAARGDGEARGGRQCQGGLEAGACRTTAAVKRNVGHDESGAKQRSKTTQWGAEKGKRAFLPLQSTGNEDKASGMWEKWWVGSDRGRHGQYYGDGGRPRFGGDGLVGARTLLNTIGVGLGPLHASWAVLCNGLGPLTLFLYSEYFSN
jgi:hypothetical protein